MTDSKDWDLCLPSFTDVAKKRATVPLYLCRLSNKVLEQMSYGKEEDNQRYSTCLEKIWLVLKQRQGEIRGEHLQDFCHTTVKETRRQTAESWILTGARRKQNCWGVSDKNMKVLFWALIRKGSNTGWECVCAHLSACTHAYLHTHPMCMCMHVCALLHMCVPVGVRVYLDTSMRSCLPQSLEQPWLVAQVHASWYNEEMGAVKQQTSGELSANKFHLRNLSFAVYF